MNNTLKTALKILKTELASTWTRCVALCCIASMLVVLIIGYFAKQSVNTIGEFVGAVVVVSVLALLLGILERVFDSEEDN
jgi:hypothetical protein